jgi:hypothetical protein
LQNRLNPKSTHYLSLILKRTHDLND